MTRIQDWTEEELNNEQKQVYDQIVSGPRGKVVGPLRIWLNNPELAKCAQQVGAYARYKTSLDKSLSELAIITTGRVWSSEFEWEHHAPLAIEAGIKKEYVETIANAKRPIFENEDEQIVFDFSAEANILKNVKDVTFKLALEKLGKTRVIDIVGICGYYSLISMTLNVFKVPTDTPDWPIPKINDFSNMLKKN